MGNKIIRSEGHKLTASPDVQADVDRTIAAYRRVVRAVSTIIMTHWPELTNAPSKCFAVESLFHPTAKRPVAKYSILSKMIGKLPSYLRRAAIEAAYGSVSSYLSNYSNWLDDAERERGTRPPRLGFSNVNPPLYGGNMVHIAPDWRSVSIKLLTKEGAWKFSTPLRLNGKMKRANAKKVLCPTLMKTGKKVILSCPVEVQRPTFIKQSNVDRVCSVDVGINTAVTAAIVDKTGTVIARKFITCGRHNDQRDDLHTQIAGKQAASNGGMGKRLGKGFCKALYTRIAGISLDAARRMSADLIAFAKAHGAQAFVVENLKGWKPKGRGRTQKKRFNRFQHRMLIKHLTFKCEELGMKLVEIFARGTSYFAYDGSGPVKRDKTNATLATFSNGRRYNADLNAAYNIAARGLIYLHNMTIPVKDECKSAHKVLPGATRKGGSERTGQNSGRSSRIPTVLADVWALMASTKAGLQNP